jgi:sec-independent protein translocase protein TatC
MNNSSDSGDKEGDSPQKTDSYPSGYATEGERPAAEDLKTAPRPIADSFAPETTAEVSSSPEAKSYWPEPDPAAPERSGSQALQAGMMTVVEHLDELRTRLFRCILYVAVGLVAGLVLAKKILQLLEAPAGNISFQALSLEEPVLVFFKVAFYAGVIFASPLILFEISRFIAPGLTDKERGVVTPIVIGSPVLFACGALFAYFCLLHPMLHFFGAFSAGVAPINQRLDFYISLVSSILLYMGLCFQLPIIIFALSFTGLVNSTMLIKIWRYAILGASLLAAVITPDPTAISMLIVMAALVGLYFLSVLLLKLFGR